MAGLPGIGGTLFPGRYLEDGLPRDVPGLPAPAALEPHRRRFVRWWAGVERECGPATGLRALFDLVAAPLAGLLGFRASSARFEAGRVRACLSTRRRTPVALVLLPWATRRTTLWRDVVGTARDVDADWCLLLAPPFVSIVDARARAARRSVDFVLPGALEPESFARLWWLAQAASFDVGLVSGPDARGARAASALDRLLVAAAAYQDAVRADLERGVLRALDAIASVIGPPRTLAGTAPFDEALTVVYRILFLLFAESRDLLPRAHEVYANAYSVASLCREAIGSEDGTGLWEGLAATSRLSRSGCAIDDLTVRPFNGRLFARAAAPSLETTGRGAGRTRPGPRDLAARQALVALGTRPGRGGREEIAYADLGVEQLGAVYERVLDLDPRAVGSGASVESVAPVASPEPGAAAPASRHSARRKESGTFYTPRPLAEFVVRRTLEPLVAGRRAAEILSLRVLDPAMGSGAFLVAACRFLAAAYERALVDEGQIGEVDVDEAARADFRRLVAERCLFGVDDNPVAVELARLSLWLATLARGKPLGFLDHRLRTGNSLAGASPDDLRRIGTGRRQARPLPLFDAATFYDTIERAARPLLELTARRDDTVNDVRLKERLWQQVAGRHSALWPWRLACSLWCTQWLWPRTAARPRPSPAELRAAIDAIIRRDRTMPPGPLRDLMAIATEAAESVRLFHWPLEFPDIFHAPDGTPLPNPGFDAIIGNPPWEMLRRDASEERRLPATGDDRRNDLACFIRQSTLYRLAGRGHVNLYQPFLERALSLARRRGRVGLVLPWGLASDDGAAELRASLLDHHGLDTIVGLDNGAGLFPIHRGLRFVVVTVRAREPAGVVRARFGVRTAAEIESLPRRDEDPGDPAYPVRLTPRLLAATGGVRRRIPDARRPQDLALADRLMTTFPALGSDAGWRARFGRELNATDDRGLFAREGLPVIEGKHIAPFTVDGSGARHFIDRRAAERALGAARVNRPRLAYRDVSGVANRLSLIAGVVPAGVVTTHTLFCLGSDLPIERQHFLCALMNSWVLNAIVRLFMGQHVTTGLVEDLPAPAWTGDPAQVRLAGLSATRAAAGPDAGLDARLQAEVARLYGLDVEEFADLANGFPRVDEAGRRLAVGHLAAAPGAL